MSGLDAHLDPEIIAAFLDEAPGYLAVLDGGLLVLEQNSGSGSSMVQDANAHARLTEMFRAAHSLKGLSASLGFDQIRDLTHRMETLFDFVRAGRLALNPQVIQTLFSVFDTLKRLVDELSEPTQQPTQIAESLHALDQVLSEVDDAGGTPTGSHADVPRERGQETCPSQVDVSPPAVGAAISETSLETPMPDPASRQQTSPDEESEASAFTALDSETTMLFVVTTNECLDEFANALIALENAPRDPSLINVAFRCAHNIKGASGAVGLRTLYRLTHNLETVLDLARSGSLELCDEVMTAVFAAVDQLRSGVTMMAEGRLIEIAKKTKVDLFDKWIGAQPAAMNATCTNQARAGQVPRGIPDKYPLIGPNAESADMSASIVTVTFPPSFQDAPIQSYLIFNKLKELAEVVQSVPDVDALDAGSAIEVIHFHIRPHVTLEEIKEAVSKYTTGDISIAPHSSGIIPKGAPAAPPAHRAQQDANNPSSSTLPGKTTAGSAPAPGTVGYPPPASPTPRAPGGDGGRSNAGDTPTAAAKPTETLRVDLERLDQLMNLGGELVINKARLFQIRSRFDAVFEHGNLGYLMDDVSNRIDRLQKDVTHLTQCETDRNALIGLSSAMTNLSRDFASIRGLMERVRSCRPVMNDFGEALHSLSRVSDGIQRRIMETRMVAIGPLFQRFRRVVRDISKATDKNVELVLHGESTELDKRMIDELGDPLTHMIRNSVDHGIESPEERVRQGKPPMARVTLDAYHRGRHICIEVKDDGRGVNLDAVRRKVVEKQLATPAELERMAEKELVQFIFKPGFSTAEKVTDLSGRGMGMDIVLSKLDALNGTIDVESLTGEGTTVTIRLPLTLAIIHAILARIGDGVYAIPLESVAEIISVSQDAIQQVARRRVIRVRNRVIRIAFLEEIFASVSQGLRTRSKDESQITLVILAVQNEQIGLVVDGLIGQEEVVIKSISDNFKNIPGISGASIMGDGSVSLILDVASMFGMLGERSGRKQDPSVDEAAGVDPTGGAALPEVSVAS